MKLYGMLDSLFVRRVAISLHYYGVAFDNLPLSVFSDYAAFQRVNPVVKAPTLTLADGTTLMESNLILSYFEAQADAAHQLLPTQPQALAEDLRILGFALAAGEKAVQHIYEHRVRPEEKSHQPWITRVEEQLHAACAAWNGLIAEREWETRKVDQVAITSAVVWRFIQYMLPGVVASTQYPHLQRLTLQMEQLPVFSQYPHD